MSAKGWTEATVRTARTRRICSTTWTATRTATRTTRTSTRLGSRRMTRMTTMTMMEATRKGMMMTMMTTMMMMTGLARMTLRLRLSRAVASGPGTSTRTTTPWPYREQAACRPWTRTRARRKRRTRTATTTGLSRLSRTELPTFFRVYIRKKASYKIVRRETGVDPTSFRGVGIDVVPDPLRPLLENVPLLDTHELRGALEIGQLALLRGICGFTLLLLLLATLGRVLHGKSMRSRELATRRVLHGKSVSNHLLCLASRVPPPVHRGASRQAARENPRVLRRDSLLGARRVPPPAQTPARFVKARAPFAFLNANSFKNRTTCACPSRSASRKGVFPAALGGRSGSAPHSIKARTASSWPKLAAHPSGSLSYQSVIFAFASNRFVLTVSSRMRSHSPRMHRGSVHRPSVLPSVVTVEPVIRGSLHRARPAVGRVVRSHPSRQLGSLLGGVFLLGWQPPLLGARRRARVHLVSLGRLSLLVHQRLGRLRVGPRLLRRLRGLPRHFFSVWGCQWKLTRRGRGRRRRGRRRRGLDLERTTHKARVSLRRPRRGGVRGAQVRDLPPRAVSACCLARMLGASVFVASAAPDIGEVSCFSSHAVTADRSYVCPSSTSNTGSSKSSAVMGHTSCSASRSAVSSADMVSGVRGRANAWTRAYLG
mmetsp:Transcript_9786/g.44537  ORF Transcript_9786/g.44537 Transcript_9786/m.44537 type:complete len:655 (-) Transcript_9786:57-2021(-)